MNQRSFFRPWLQHERGPVSAAGYRPLRPRLPSSPPKTHITSDDVIAALWNHRAVGSVPEGVISVQMGLPAWHTED